MSRFVPPLLLGLLSSTVAFGQTAPDSGDVVVNEIQYAPMSSTNEYIELYNRSGEPVALSDLEYADDNEAYAPVTEVDTTLQPGAYVVLVRDLVAFQSAFPSTDVLAPGGWDALNNGGDTVFLRHAPTDRILDAVPYSPTWGGADGQSLERIDPAGPSDAASNFGSSVASAGGTPAAQNSIYDPDETPPSLERATPTAEGNSVTATFSEPVEPSTVSADAFSFSAMGAPAIVSARVVPGDPSRVRCVLSRPLSEGTFTLVATNVADRRGNVQPETSALFTYVETVPPDSGDVVVTEIMYAPSPPSNEFIEVFNRSEHAIDLSALSYADENKDFAPIAERRTPLRPDSHAVLVRDTSAFMSAFPDTPFLAPDGWDALNNGGDTVVLRHRASGTVLDRVPYAAAWGGSDGRSLERIDPAGPSNDPSNFGSSESPQGATPGGRNSLFAPDTTPPAPFFAEQTTADEATVYFTEPVAPSTVRPEAFRVEGEIPEAVDLSADSIARLTFPSLPRSDALQIGGIEDLVGNLRPDTTVVLALRPDSGSIALNEIMFAPLADDFDDRPNQVEYLEIANRSGVALTLNGLHVTDRPTENGTADTIRAGRLRALPPNGYAVITAAPNDPASPSSSQLAAAFPSGPLDSDSTAFLPVATSQLGLANDGDRVRFHRADTVALATVDYSPDWHAEGLEDPRGTALERVSLNGRPNAPDNWTSSVAPDGGTPGTRNSVATPTSEELPPSARLKITPSPFSVERDGATEIKYQLPEAPSQIRVRIYDARGRPVRTLEEARLVGQEGTLVWNGHGDDDRPVRIGPYVVLFEAVRAEDGTVTELTESVVVARPLD